MNNVTLLLLFSGGYNLQSVITVAVQVSKANHWVTLSPQIASGEPPLLALAFVNAQWYSLGATDVAKATHARSWRHWAAHSSVVRPGMIRDTGGTVAPTDKAGNDVTTVSLCLLSEKKNAPEK